jgi:hypothetical protein
MTAWIASRARPTISSVVSALRTMASSSAVGARAVGVWMMLALMRVVSLESC